MQESSQTGRWGTWEHAMGSKSKHSSCSEFFEHFGGFAECARSVYHVVHCKIEMEEKGKVKEELEYEEVAHRKWAKEKIIEDYKGRTKKSEVG
jgi:hypothetical protein